MHKFIIIMYGPTGVGKSDIATALAHELPLEIVNCDVGQFYTPFAIGTAKPDWKNEKAPHHLFDVFNEPQDFTVIHYKAKVLKLCDEIWARNAIPVLVGGSGFYIKSLFFTPLPAENKNEENDIQKQQYGSIPTHELFVLLQTVDPVRAKQIHPHDRYRLERALTLAQTRAGVVHTLVPLYEDLGFPVLLVCLSRNRKQICDRIKYRTKKMFEQGWVEEVAALQNTAWIPFLKRKKLIGYDDIALFLEHGGNEEEVITTIVQKTCQYAKRQMTFWRMLQKKLTPYLCAPSAIKEIDITDEKMAYSRCKEYISMFLKSL